LTTSEPTPSSLEALIRNATIRGFFFHELLKKVGRDAERLTPETPCPSSWVHDNNSKSGFPYYSSHSNLVFGEALSLECPPQQLW
jgi:hypothetical protein